MLYILCKEDYKLLQREGKSKEGGDGRGGGKEEKASRYCKHTSYSIMPVELDV